MAEKCAMRRAEEWAEVRCRKNDNAPRGRIDSSCDNVLFLRRKKIHRNT